MWTILFLIAAVLCAIVGYGGMFVVIPFFSKLFFYLGTGFAVLCGLILLYKKTKKVTGETEEKIENKFSDDIVQTVVDGYKRIKKIGK